MATSWGPMLLAVDGSACSADAAKTAGELARLTGQLVVVAHVHEVVASEAWRESVEPPAATDEIIGPTVEALIAEGVEARGEVVVAPYGDVAERLLALAAELQAALIVVGSRGHSALSRMLVGSVSNKLIQLSTVPVLIVR